MRCRSRAALASQASAAVLSTFDAHSAAVADGVLRVALQALASLLPAASVARALGEREGA
jgi:hypothetical protein